MIKNVFGLFMLAGCATYSEPGYDPSAAVHQYEGSYSARQYQSDRDRVDVTARRQQAYDRHQDAVLRRVSRRNAETRRNIQTGAMIIGAGIGIASILRED